MFCAIGDRRLVPTIGRDSSVPPFCQHERQGVMPSDDIREWATDALVLECRKEARPVVPRVTTGERRLVLAQNGGHGSPNAPWWFSVRLTCMTRVAMALAMRVVRRRHVRRTPTHSEDPCDLVVYHPMARSRLARPTRGAGPVFCPRSSIASKCRPELVQ